MSVIKYLSQQKTLYQGWSIDLKGNLNIIIYIMYMKNYVT